MWIHRRAAVTLFVSLLACLAVAPTSAAQGGPRARPEGTPSTSSEAWAWPLASPHLVLRDYRAPVSEYASGHRGIDLAALPGDPVYAVADGTVTFAGTVVDRPTVSLTHGGGLVSSVEPVTPLVAAGEPVRRGQLLGRITAGGHCGEGCLHLGARMNGRYVSPMRYLGGVRRAVLLPVDAAAVVVSRRESRRSLSEQVFWRAVLHKDQSGQARG